MALENLLLRTDVQTYLNLWQTNWKPRVTQPGDFWRHQVVQEIWSEACSKLNLRRTMNVNKKLQVSYEKLRKIIPSNEMQGIPPYYNYAIKSLSNELLWIPSYYKNAIKFVSTRVQKES